MVAKDAPVGDEQVPVPAEGETDVADAEASQEVMNLLGQHVPLALLADLAIPSGPQSPQILEDEGLPAVAWWEGKEEEPAPGEGEPAKH